MDELKWGQTPWDNMSRDELLKTVWRMWAVITELNSVVSMSRSADQFKAHINPDSDIAPNPYWDKAGVGGNALEMARQVIEPVENQYGSSEVYRAFFRYAEDLLFEANGYQMIGANWVICSECGAMWGTRTRDLVGQPCKDHPGGKPGCNGTLRKLEWSDLRPVEVK